MALNCFGTLTSFVVSRLGSLRRHLTVHTSRFKALCTHSTCVCIGETWHFICYCRVRMPVNCAVRSSYGEQEHCCGIIWIYAQWSMQAVGPFDRFSTTRSIRPHLR